MARTWQVIVIMALTGCGGRAASGSESESGETGSSSADTGESESDSDTSEPVNELCEVMLDPATYADGPVFTPTPQIATPECPALDGKMMIDLPTPVQVTGTLLVDGVPTPGEVLLTGRNGEGTAREDSLDGSFAIHVWPGRYDVSASPGNRDLTKRVDVLTDVDLTSPAELMIDLPPAVSLSGTMTMDGEPAPDPFGYLFVDHWLMLYLPDGSYELQVSPGTYELEYFWCNHNGVDGESGICQGFEGLPTADAPHIGPEQRSPVMFGSVDVAADTIFDIDVPTARLTGLVELDGAPPEDHVNFWLEVGGNDGDSFAIEDDGSFDIRLVRGEYQAWLGGDAHGQVPEIGLLDGDVDVEIIRGSALVTATAPTLPLRNGQLHMGLLEIGSDHGGKALSWTPGDPWLEQPVWACTADLVVGGAYCWSVDLDQQARLITTLLEVEKVFEGAVPLELDVPFAAVHIELNEIGAYSIEHLHPLFLQLEPEGDELPRGDMQQFRRDEEEWGFDLHGYLVPGRYRATYASTELGTFDIVDGTTLQLHIPTQTVELELSVDGMPVGPGSAHHRLKLTNLDTLESEMYSEDDPKRRTFAPGRYELRYHNTVVEQPQDAVLPQNGNVLVGCVTIEN